VSTGLERAGQQNKNFKCLVRVLVD
jgi:hypothetical protein